MQMTLINQVNIFNTNLCNWPAPKKKLKSSLNKLVRKVTKLLSILHLQQSPFESLEVNVPAVT